MPRRGQTWPGEDPVCAVALLRWRQFVSGRPGAGRYRHQQLLEANARRPGGELPLGHAALRTFGDGSSSTGHRLRTFSDGSCARVLIGTTGHRPRSAPQPQAPQRYHRPEASRRHRPWPQASQRCHRPQAPRLYRFHGPRASQHCRRHSSCADTRLIVRKPNCRCDKSVPVRSDASVYPWTSSRFHAAICA